MRAIVIDTVAWSVCVSVCVLVTTVSPAETDKPIETPFGRLTERYMGREAESPSEKGHFMGMYSLIIDYSLL